MAGALYLCLHLRDFATKAMECARPELRHRPLAILSGTAPLECVFAVNQQARELNVERGMSRMQAESFAALAIRQRERAEEDRAFAKVGECAARFSPRIETIAAPQEQSSDATLVLDISNSSRLLGMAEQISQAVDHAVRAAGFEASIAVSRNAYAAVLAARGNTGITIIPSGQEAQTLAPLPIAVMEPAPEQTETLSAWGIRTLGQLAALPSRSLAARLGQSGQQLQMQARGEYDHLLVPTEEPADAPISAPPQQSNGGIAGEPAIELEHPVELLEPLLFLIRQLLQQVIETVQQRALAIASLELCLFLEQKTIAGAPLLPAVGRSGKLDHRIIRPALPERDGLVLLKLIQLELELRPPASAVSALRIVAHPARPQTAQHGLFAAQAPEPGRMAVLLARLRKLVGEGRAGSPELLDSRAPEAFRMTGFDPGHNDDEGKQSTIPAGAPFKPVVGLSGVVAPPHPSPALRILRPPREVAVELCRGAPVAMQCEGQRRTVHASSGPWRTSGEWWTHPGWCREEWEVVLHPQLPHPSPKAGAMGHPPVITNEKLQNETLRLAHDPANGGWYVIGIYD